MMERELADYLDLPVTEVEPIVVQSWIDDMSDRPGAAKSFLKLLKTFFRFCAAPTSKILTSNPAQFVEGPSYEKKGFTAWDEADAAAFEAYWPLNSKQRLAYALMSYLGQRVSDAAVLGAAHEIPGGMIRVFRERNNGGLRSVLDQRSRALHRSSEPEKDGERGYEESPHTRGSDEKVSNPSV